MALLDILIPQLGEGLQEVVILTLNKKPGDFVKRDELLYSMETDKAVMEVESPYEGVLKEWLADENSVVPIGAVVARMESSETAETEAATPTASPIAADAGASPAEIQIPPRTRAHAKELGLSDEELRRIPAPSGKLMPADVDAYITARGPSGSGSDPKPAEGHLAAGFIPVGTIDRPLSQQQRLFAHRLKRSAQTVIPATMKQIVDWGSISAIVKELRAREENGKPTEFQTFAFCVAQAAREFPKFRSTLINDETARESANINLGIAVARPNNDLVTAVVPQADTLVYADFIRTAQERIRSAREGDDQAGADTHMLLTYLGSYNVIDAIPVLVSPAIAVLFLGATYEQNGRTVANLVLTFDHRLINGVEAAQFMKAIVETAEQPEKLVKG